MTSKVGRALVAAMVVLGFTTCLPLARVGDGERGITVAGEAEVKVAPDQVVLTVGVETANPVLTNGKRENDAVVRRVIDSIAKHGVESRHIQTEHIGIEPHYRARFESDEVLRYIVRRTITVDLRSIDKFEGILGDALAAGANYVHGVQFRTTELRKYRDQARTLAVEAAKEKAALLARSLGRRVGAAASIHEDNVGWWSGYGSWWGGRYSSMSQNVSQAGADSPISPDAITAPGQISVTARVTVRFDLE